MEMKQCSSGRHYYDASIYSECPYCKADASGMSENFTRPLFDGNGDGAAMAMNNGDSFAGGAGGFQNANRTVPLVGDAFPQFEEMQENSSQMGQGSRTVAVIKEELGMDPVVGWLVCRKGPDKGKDFRLHSDYNYIGRSERMDVCVHDDTISKENHAVVGFDTRDEVFYFGPAGGRGIVRVNGKALLNTVEIKIYDRLEIGRSEFIFVPLCGEKFSWKDEEKGEDK